MKNLNTPYNINTSNKINNDLKNRNLQSNDFNRIINKVPDFNEFLFSSLPYPAMFIRRKDRIIIAANDIAQKMGAQIGKHCWIEFGKSKSTSSINTPESIRTLKNYGDKKKQSCSFCQGEKCFIESKEQNNPELSAFGRIWNTYWIKVNEEVFYHYLIDITEHHQLEESLRESESFLKQTQQIAMLGTYNFDLTTGTWESSEVLAEIFGIDATTKKTYEEWIFIVHPDMQEMMLNYFYDEVIGKKKRFNKEYKIKRKSDGEERWVHGIGDLKFNKKNEPVRMIGVIQDITERKHSEEEKRFLLASVENTSDRIVVKDLDLKIVAANKAWLNGRGVKSINEIVGKTDAEAFDTPADSEPVKTFMEDERKAQKLPQGEFVIKELPIKLHSGQDTISLVKRYPIFDESGNLFGTGTIATDITDRKKMEDALRKSEMKYKLVSENIADGIFIYKNDKILYANHSICKMFGYKEHEFDGLSLTNLVNKDQREYVKKFISFDIKKDQIRNTEIECIRKDGSVFFVEIFLNYVVNENQIYGVVHDITEKKQIQKRNIVKAIIETEEKERAHFSKELHDGIGPLLSTIKLYLQWSVRPNRNIPREEIIKKAEEILEEALTTVKEISFKLSPHLLTNHGLTSAVQNFSRKLEETNTINIDFQSNLTRRIEIEIEVALYRAIIECVNNTIKYAKASHININLIDNGTEILLNYKDNGVGFNIEEVQNINKGMGLFNLQNRIETIGGKIKMNSKPQQGVDYHIIVPANNLIMS